jgi:hypothetical protein
MALSDMQTAIADELSRTDLSTQITREINNAITFYQNKRFWFNEDTMVTLTTIAGQRDYKLPPNFAAVTDVRSKLGNIEYFVNPSTIQYLDKINWTSTFQSSYIELYAFWNSMIRLYPAPTAGLPLYIRGNVLLPTLTTTAATKSYAFATSFSVNDTIQDPNGNIQTCVTGGTTQTAPTKTYTANTAYSVNDTVQDGNGNIQTCSTAGTTGYLLVADKTQWGRIVGSLTTDGTAVWNLSTLMWSTDFDSYTVDGSVVWHLTSNLTNAWMSSAEELIRTRATRMIYQRYIKDIQQAQSYQAMERDCVLNLYEKNIGQTGMGTLTGHL